MRISDWSSDVCSSDLSEYWSRSSSRRLRKSPQPPRRCPLMTNATTRPASDYPSGGDAFRHRHLTGIAQLTPWEISYILHDAEQRVDLNRSGQAKPDRKSVGEGQGVSVSLELVGIRYNKK